MIKKLSLGLTIIALVAKSTDLLAQDPPVAPTQKQYANKTWSTSIVPDGVIDREEHVYRVQPWKRIRENDVAFYHRVWTVIPVKEKQNQAFIYTGDEFSAGGSFIEILNMLVTTQQIEAFSSLDDRFTKRLNPEEFRKEIGGRLDTLYIEDPDTGEITPTVQEKEFNIEHVTKYMVKEDWIFDRNAGKMVRMIIGIAPMRDIYDGDRYINTVPMYWVNYPTVRNVLGQFEVYNPYNQVKRMTWIDYLEGGYYSSYVIKYSKNNPTGQFIKGTTENNLHALIEGEQVLEDLLNMELDMWER